MSTFTLAVSYLSASNLPWFMDLTFQVPMQYCSFQHWTLLLSPVTSTAGCYFCFGSVSSFFLELLPHSSPVATTDLGSSSFSIIHTFLPFHAIHGILKARILKWFAIPFFHGPLWKIIFSNDVQSDPSYLLFTVSLWQSLALVIEFTYFLFDLEWNIVTPLTSRI